MISSLKGGIFCIFLRKKEKTYIFNYTLEVLNLDLINDLKKIEKEAEKELKEVADLDKLEEIRITFLNIFNKNSYCCQIIDFIKFYFFPRHFIKYTI